MQGQDNEDKYFIPSESFGQELILAPETAASLERSFEKSRSRSTPTAQSTKQYPILLTDSTAISSPNNSSSLEASSQSLSQPLSVDRSVDRYHSKSSTTSKSAASLISSDSDDVQKVLQTMPSYQTQRSRGSGPVDVDALTVGTPNTMEAGLAGSHAIAVAQSVLRQGGSRQQAEELVLSILLKGKEPGAFPRDSSKLREAQNQARMLVSMAKVDKSSGPRQSNLGQSLDHRAQAKQQKIQQQASGGKQKRRVRREAQPVRLRINRGQSSWVAHGYKAIAPKKEGKSYFASLADRRQKAQKAENVPSKFHVDQRVVSICIPCFNEEASALKRTLESLQKSYLPRGVVLEIAVAMDGLKQIDPSMAAYLRSLFGISVNEKDPKKNPFITFPKANTVIVESTNDIKQKNISLIIKRNNKRKVNSQKWWLFAHAKDAQAEFAFATDCGIVFDRKCLMLLVERMDREPNLSGLTGYQRVMTSRMQGDGRFEFCRDPMGFFLRQLQSYDFEMSQSTTKSLVDSFGFIPVLPGPCSLFRYDHFEGIVDDYFHLTTMPLAGDASDIVLGNVQLAEDRFPPVLLTFRDKDNPAPHTRNNKPLTGFEHDATFYFEAEKPLGQLVKQRRRWINGAYMAGYWVLKGTWIKKSQAGWITRLGACSVLFFELMQGLLIRMVTPATLACGLFFMVTITPAIYHQDAEKVAQILDGERVDDMLLIYAGAAGGAYLMLFAIFMFAHTPKAARMKDEDGDTYYQIDSKSAYRPFLFFLSFIVNAALAVQFFYVGVGVYMMIGWYDSPIYFKVLSCMIVVPYVVAFFDGIINSKVPSIRAVWNLFWLTPMFMLASIWFYVWFPSYASARISDLSWGNRAAHQEAFASSQVARHRAYLGRVVSVSIVLSNWIAAGIIIAMMRVVEQFLTVVLFSLLGFNVLLHAINMVDMVFRFFTKRVPHWLCGEPPPPLRLRADNISDTASEDSEDDDDFTLDEYTVDTKENLMQQYQQRSLPHLLPDDESSDSDDDTLDNLFVGKQYISPKKKKYPNIDHQMSV